MELDDIYNQIADAPEPDAEGTNFTEVYDRYASDLYNEMCSWSEPKREMVLNDASQRFSTALPLRLVRNTTVALVGAGGLGNWIWRVLMGMGFTNLHLFDADIVGPENIGPQVHNLIDVGYPKVEAVRRAALAFRGVNIRTYRQYVTTFNEIYDCTGCKPDVVIGATDSTVFRNSMIQDVYDGKAYATQLFIDLRMSLGDWNAYITTPKMFAQDKPFYLTLLNGYKNEACFAEEEAVHEPCTARAITYTGANVASYVGAFLHWWLTEGVTKDKWWLLSTFYSDARMDGATFNWRYTYSSRDFHAETKTAAERNRIANLNRLEPQEAAYSSYLRNAWHIGEQDLDTYTCKAYRGIDLNGHEVLAVSDNGMVAWAVLDITAGKVSLDSKRPYLPVCFQFRNTGWDELAKLYQPKRNYHNVCVLLKDVNSNWYLFAAIDGDAFLYRFTVDSNGTIVFGERADLHVLVDTKLEFCTWTGNYKPGQRLCAERNDDGDYNWYKLPDELPGLPNTNPRIEGFTPEPEDAHTPEPAKMPLASCAIGDIVKFEGMEYEVAGYMDARCTMMRLNGLTVGSINLVVPAEAEVERD